MRPIVDLFRHERRARIFFAVLTQSALGTGAGYVALLLLAYDRFRSPWAITLVLLAELVPAMVLGPVFGAVADRWSRRWCTVLADLIRAAAFVGIGFVHDFGATVALAALAGIGTALFTPATLAALPSLVERQRLPAATSTYGAIADIGYTGGPGLAAVLLMLSDASVIAVANGATFAISALVLIGLDFGASPEREPGPARSFASDVRDGLRASAGIVGVRIVLGASAAALVFAAVFNVGELPFARDDLGAGDAGYAVLAALFGLGVVLGSLSGSRGGDLPSLKRRYLQGLLLMGGGLLLSGLAPGIEVALLTFALAGAGNGLVLVYERLLIQATVPDQLAGRLFGVKDALTAWAFAAGFVAAGGLIALVGARPMIVAAGVGGVLVSGLAWVWLRDEWTQAGASGREADALGDGVAGQDGAHLVGGGDGGLALGDDLHQHSDDGGVELRPRTPG
jgi:MFS family permease